jgi:hypothetical protein
VVVGEDATIMGSESGHPLTSSSGS